MTNHRNIIFSIFLFACLDMYAADSSGGSSLVSSICPSSNSHQTVFVKPQPQPCNKAITKINNCTRTWRMHPHTKQTPHTIHPTPKMPQFERSLTPHDRLYIENYLASMPKDWKPFF